VGLTARGESELGSELGFRPWFGPKGIARGCEEQIEPAGAWVSALQRTDESTNRRVDQSTAQLTDSFLRIAKCHSP
jgi:hypothetical protein